MLSFSSNCCGKGIFKSANDGSSQLNLHIWRTFVITTSVRNVSECEVSEHEIETFKNNYFLDVSLLAHILLCLDFPECRLRKPIRKS